MEKWANLVLGSELEFGGSVTQAAGLNSSGLPAYFMHSFVNHGRLSTVVEPNETNLAVVVDCQPSVITGATNTIIRVTLLELTRDVGQYTSATGGVRMVCDPSPLPWLAAA
jgi:hypothetical protein